MAIHILIRDDNPIELKINRTYLTTFASLYKVKVEVAAFKNSKDALVYAENQKIDIAFLDINMGEHESTGIHLARKLLQKYPDIVNIFVTGEMVSIPEVFDARAFDYIQKPIDSEKFKLSFVRAVKQVIGIQNRQSTAQLLITVDNLKRKIRQSNILYIEKKQSQSDIVLKNKESFLVYETIKSLSERLESDFIQISQSVIVNLSEVLEIRSGEIWLKSGESFAIGRTYNKELKKTFENYKLR